jgi:hypothetical protein
VALISWGGKMRDQKVQLQKWCWWDKGECVVEVLRSGHFPTTAMVKMPNDREIEVDIDELHINFD